MLLKYKIFSYSRTVSSSPCGHRVPGSSVCWWGIEHWWTEGFQGLAAWSEGTHSHKNTKHQKWIVKSELSDVAVRFMAGQKEYLEHFELNRCHYKNNWAQWWQPSSFPAPCFLLLNNFLLSLLHTLLYTNTVWPLTVLCAFYSCQGTRICWCEKVWFVLLTGWNLYRQADAAD